MADLSGQKLGNYRLTRLLGHGGFAQVYLAEQIYLGTPAAIKVLDARVVGEEAFQKFQQEAKTIANLKHPHIVGVRDFAVDVDGTPFLVMDFAPYGTLAKRHPRGTILPPNVIISYVQQMASALQFAHDRNIMHLDVKPVNMLIGGNQDILLSDFGAALKTLSTRDPGRENIVGTLQYMSPEHLRGHPEMASDQYALGISLYEWLSGYPPFQGSDTALYSQHNFTTPSPLSGRIRGVTQSIDRVVQKALEKHPQQRFQRVQDFANAYDEAVRQSLRSPGAFIIGSPSPSRSGAPFNTTLPGVSPIPPTLPGMPVSPLHWSPGQAGDQFAWNGHDSGQRGLTAYPLTHSSIPEHPLVGQERAFIQRAQRVMQEYQREVSEIERERQEEEQASLAEKRQTLIEADRAVEKLRHVLTDARNELDEAGWSWWAHLRQVEAKPEEPVLSNDPVIHFRNCYAVAGTASNRLMDFLQRFPRPRIAGKIVAFITAVLAAVLGGLLLMVTGAHFMLVGDTIAGAILFCGVFSVLWYTLVHVLRKAYVTLAHAGRLGEVAYRRRGEEIEKRFEARNEEADRHFEQRHHDLERALQGELNELWESYKAFCDAAGVAAAPWTDVRWDIRATQTTQTTQAAAPPVARIGTLALPSIYGLPPLPALVSSPQGDNLLIKTTRAARQTAMEAAQAFIMRLLATQPAGKVHFTIIDTTELGNILQPFLLLKDEHESVGTGAAAIGFKEIEQQLGLVVEYIQRFNRRHSALDSTQSAYHLANEPFHVIVVMGFPTDFTQAAASDLLTIARNGPRCGVSTIIIADLDVPLPSSYSFDTAALERVCHVIEWNGEQFTWRDQEFSQGRLTFDKLPPQAQADHLLQAVRQQLRQSTSLEHNAPLRVLLKTERWPASLAAGTTAWPGHSTARQAPLSLTFRPESGSHLLMIGRREEMALDITFSTLISLAAQRSPEHMHLYVVDTSARGDVASLLERLLPRHVRRVVTRQQIHATLSQVISEVYGILQQRRDSSRDDGSDIYLIVHGLHRVDDLRPHSGLPSLADQFASIARQGPESGVHIIAWCDKQNSVKSMLGEDIPGYFDYHIEFEPAAQGSTPDLSGPRGDLGGSLNYAMLFNAALHQSETFRPYALPSQEWLQAAAEQIARKTS